MQPVHPNTNRADLQSLFQSVSFAPLVGKRECWLASSSIRKPAGQVLLVTVLFSGLPVCGTIELWMDCLLVYY